MQNHIEIVDENFLQHYSRRGEGFISCWGCGECFREGDGIISNLKNGILYWFHKKCWVK